MAMRPRTSGGANNPTGNRQRGAAVRPVYEDFKPKSEWIQDQASDILLIYLPGFTKESLKVSTEGTNILRIRGERLVIGNKWQRFQEDFQVPDYYNIRGIRARLEGGILKITVPKKIINPPKKEESKPTSSATTSQKIPEIPPPKAPKDSLTPKVQESPVLPKVPKVQENISEKITAPNKEDKAKGFQESPVPPKSISPVSESMKEKLLQKDEVDSGASKHQETLNGTKSELGNGEMERGKRITELVRGGNKSEKTELVDKRIQESERIGAQKTAFVDQDEAKYRQKTATSSGTGHFEPRNLKKAVKSLAESDEERKLLVNMGAAVLVIMALGAYIYHTVKS